MGLWRMFLYARLGGGAGGMMGNTEKMGLVVVKVKAVVGESCGNSRGKCKGDDGQVKLE